ncbi:hypothetical protein D9619_006993 [Psilocybe cf. subviscida]|uniref:C2H2-type domain-containing protein n=1 Tax=Psilocybe cf. subviscida TaxID=2480587 RepID=A0A8H5B254_9AGAR|nr:hypothetical protein D9619_006993 [Psilocybe cf. subviscida]
MSTYPYIRDPSESPFMGALSTYDDYTDFGIPVYQSLKLEDDPYAAYQPDNALLSDAALQSSDDSGASSRSSASPRPDTRSAELDADANPEPKRDWATFLASRAIPTLERAGFKLERSDFIEFDDFPSAVAEEYNNETTAFESDEPAIMAPTSITLPTVNITWNSSRVPSRRNSTYVEESDESDDDDEYNPAFDTTTSRKRRRGQADVITKKRKVGARASTSGPIPTSTSRSAHNSASASCSASTSTSSGRRDRPPPGSRNHQAVEPEMRRKLLRLLDCTAATMYDWKCPLCDWEQGNHRMPDFKRHIKTHLRLDTETGHGHFCEGVPVEKANLYNIPEDAEAYEFNGRMMIGGCMKSFSRRDARKRHFKKVNNTCAMYRGD